MLAGSRRDPAILPQRFTTIVHPSTGSSSSLLMDEGRPVISGELHKIPQHFDLCSSVTTVAGRVGEGRTLVQVSVPDAPVCSITLRALSVPLNCTIRPFSQLCASRLQSLMRQRPARVCLCVCLLLHSAHKIMYMYGGPRGAAAPPAPTDARPVTHKQTRDP